MSVIPKRGTGRPQLFFDGGSLILEGDQVGLPKLKPLRYVCLQPLDPLKIRLGLLFLVRTTMAFQFESVAAIGPVLQREFNVGLPDIGMLIGLYLLPGVVIALPGGAIGRALGDKRTVLVGCAIMFIGNVIMAFTVVWAVQVGGRLLTGVGVG